MIKVIFFQRDNFYYFLLLAILGINAVTLGMAEILTLG